MKKILSIILFCLSAASALADKIELTRMQASDLFVVLSKIDAGLAPANAVIIADNINALRPSIDAMDKGKVAAQRKIRAIIGVTVLPDGRILYASIEAERAAEPTLSELEAKLSEPLKFELTRVDFSGDEVTATKIAPRDLAVIRQYLKPKL
jgi:hypothetical protein